MSVTIHVACSLPTTRFDRRQIFSPVASLTITDEQLLSRIAGGDREAFAELFDRYGRAVHTVCWRVLNDPGMAEDAAQEAFAAAWRAARGFDPARGSVTGWMLAIARNAAIDMSRRRVAQPTDRTPEVHDAGPLPEDRAAAEEEAFRVQAALACLAPHERELLELAYFAGMSQSEIAARLALPLGTVKTRTRTALRRLANELEELR